MLFYTITQKQPYIIRMLQYSERIHSLSEQPKIKYIYFLFTLRIINSIEQNSISPKHNQFQWHRL